MELWICLIDPDIHLDLPLGDHQSFGGVASYGLHYYDLGGDAELTDDQKTYLDNNANVADYTVCPIVANDYC